jgi:hypothetical protein
MPRVQASFVLPYHLEIQSGVYPTGHAGRELEVQEIGPWSMTVSTAHPLPGMSFSGVSESSSFQPTTVVSITEDMPDTEQPDEQRELNARLADQLLLLTNRLLRSYRAITRNAAITELSRAEASPFRFRVVSGESGPVSWRTTLKYGSTLAESPAQTTQTITERMRNLLASGSEPDVADLFLLDAELAIHEGRFREAVLFCWSTIDSSFSRKYDQLVDSTLTGEWSESRLFFKGLDFGLRNKMTAALFLVTGRSFFREPGDFWQRISTSYNKRNSIIHRGENAHENDARMALDVARRVVEIMAELQSAPTPNHPIPGNEPP